MIPIEDESKSSSEKNYEKKYPARYECENGYRVNSTLERDLDNWLHKKRISHIYRPEVSIPEVLKPSFMIHNSKYQIIYIEICEKPEDPVCRNDMNEKFKIYTKHDLNFMEILPEDLANPDITLSWKFSEKEVLIAS